VSQEGATVNEGRRTQNNNSGIGTLNVTMEKEGTAGEGGSLQQNSLLQDISLNASVLDVN
jgi:hypothetical protein